MLVAALTPEAATEAVHAWLAERATRALGVSDWTKTETASALSMKVRLGHLTEDQRRDVDDILADWLDGSLEVIAVPRAAYDDAARHLRRHDTGLRAGDALHLATSSLHGARLVTLDRRQADAAWALKLDALLVAERP